jgi:hypothetical protein
MTHKWRELGKEDTDEGGQSWSEAARARVFHPPMERGKDPRPARHGPGRGSPTRSSIANIDQFTPDIYPATSAATATAAVPMPVNVHGHPYPCHHHRSPLSCLQPQQSLRPATHLPRVAEAGVVAATVRVFLDFVDISVSWFPSANAPLDSANASSCAFSLPWELPFLSEIVRASSPP